MIELTDYLYLLRLAVDREIDSIRTPCSHRESLRTQCSLERQCLYPVFSKRDSVLYPVFFKERQIVFAPSVLIDSMRTLGANTERWIVFVPSVLMGRQCWNPVFSLRDRQCSYPVFLKTDSVCTQCFRREIDCVRTQLAASAARLWLISCRNPVPGALADRASKLSMAPSALVSRQVEDISHSESRTQPSCSSIVTKSG